MAALITGLVLGGTTLTYAPALAAPAHVGAAPVVRAAVVATEQTVSRLSLTSGPLAGGGKLLVTGKALATSETVDGVTTWIAETVKFGTVTVAPAKVTALSATALEVEVPAGEAATPSVTVLVGDALKGPKYTYVVDKPVVTTVQADLDDWDLNSEKGLLDANGAPAQATITGTGFSKATTVVIGGKKAKIPTLAKGATFDSTKLVFSVPTGLVGVQDVVVSDARGSTYVGHVTYVATAVDVTGVSPAYAVVEVPTVVTVTGTGLDVLTSAVLTDGTTSVKAAVRKVSAEKAYVTVPAGTALNGNLKVSGAFGNADQTAFERKAAGAPTVTAVTAGDTDLTKGGVVTLTGTNLVSLKSVKVLSRTATVKTYVGSAITVTSATTATVKLPALLNDAKYDVQVATGHATPSAKLELTVGTPVSTTPVVTSAETTDGASVTLGGTLLTGATKVVFTPASGSPVEVTTGFTGNTATALTVAVDPALSAGTYGVVVTTPGGSSASYNVVVPAPVTP